LGAAHWNQPEGRISGLKRHNKRWTNGPRRRGARSKTSNKKPGDFGTAKKQRGEQAKTRHGGACAKGKKKKLIGTPPKTRDKHEERKTGLLIHFEQA